VRRQANPSGVASSIAGAGDDLSAPSGSVLNGTHEVELPSPLTSGRSSYEGAASCRSRTTKPRTSPSSSTHARARTVCRDHQGHLIEMPPSTLVEDVFLGDIQTALRGQKAAFPNCDVHRRETSPGGRPANPQPRLDHPHQRARACQLTCASTPSGRGDGRDHAVRRQVRAIRLEAACRPPTRISSGALEGSQTILRSVGHHSFKNVLEPLGRGFRPSTTSILEPDQRLRRRLGSFEPRPRKASLPSDVLEITRRIGIPRWG
jgi:hypothetical protein